MPLKVRLPAIAVGVAVLWWVMNGGAGPFVHGFVEHVVRPDRSSESGAQVANARAPEGTAWVQGLLEQATNGESPVPELRDLDTQVFFNGVRGETLGATTHSGSFFHEPTNQVFIDVGVLSSIDRFARPDPMLPKIYTVARTLARATRPGAAGAALDEEAGRLASALGWVDSKAPTPNYGMVVFWPAKLDELRTQDLPNDWTLHPSGSSLPAPEAAAAFQRGLSL